MRLGRSGGRRTLQTSNVSGLARRAENRLAAVADAYAAKQETALAVDGVPLFIWNKHDGRYLCNCSNDNALNGLTATNKLDASGKSVSIISTGKKSKRNRFTPVDSLVRDETTNSNASDTFLTGPRDKILGQDYADVRKSKFDYADELISKSVNKHSGDLADSLDAFNEADDMITSKVITCPICLGSGKIDSWQPAGGNRLLFELSNRYAKDMNIDILDGNVPRFYMSAKGYIEWEFDLPITWLTLERATLFDGMNAIPRSAYRLQLTLPDDTVIENLNKNALRSLKGDYTLTEGKCKLKLQPLDGNELFATHFDLIYMNAAPFRGQLPEIEIPYEDEFADWNLTINIELTAKAILREGSYICDGKYKRVWKVDAFSPKRLANNQVIGYTATLRALHSFEKLFVLFNMFVR